MQDTLVQIERLKQRLRSAEPKVRNLCEQFLPGSSDTAADLGRVRQLDSINDLRLRMIAVATVMHRQLGTSLEMLLQGPQRAVHAWRGDLSTFRLSDAQVLLLPPQPRGVRCWELLEGLNEFYLNDGRDSSWVVDCSGFQEPEMLVFSSLVGYQRSLAQSGFTLQLVWLNPSALPPDMLTQFKKQFSLLLKAGHYFSAPT
ncbi:MAG: hypothetical protein QY326_01295 [Bdellovibrionota bacterium]|nr:MAG: hypothetical protein QY326_01295 [Bdellovibrionota bacterium]